MATHSNLSPSSAERWSNCAGSVQASAAMPASPSNKYSAEGTVAHGIAEELVMGRTTVEALMARVGHIVDQDGFDITIIDEMVTGAIEYRDTIAKDTLEMDAEDRKMKIVGKAEVRVHAKSIDDEIRGTSDYLLFQKGNRLIVYDYKFGVGIVNAEQNKQMGLYAVGALDGEAKGPYDTVEMVIVQPRGAGDSVRRWVAPKGWIDNFRAEMKMAAVATRIPDAPRTAGAWCKWCPALPTCSTAIDEVQTRAAVVFSEPVPVLPDISKLPIEKITQALGYEDFINHWFESAKLRVRTMLENGEAVPGYKLVEGKSNRKWVDENKVIEELEPLFGRASLFESKLLSPAKLEKMVGKGKLDHLTFKPEATKAVALESDPRPEARRSVTEVFDAIPVESEKSENDALDELLGIAKPKKIWA